TPILSMVERNGRAKIYKVNGDDAENLLPKIEEIPKSTQIYTDQWGAYNSLAEDGWKHQTVNHNSKDRKKRYVDGSASTNNTECVFSNLKGMIGGTYRNVSDSRLQLYLNEHSFRHSFRMEKDYGFEILMRSLIPLSEVYASKYRNDKII